MNECAPFFVLCPPRDCYLLPPPTYTPSAVMTAAWPPGVNMVTFPPGVALAVNPVWGRYRARVGVVEEACVDQNESYVSADGAMGVYWCGGYGGSRG